MQPADTKSLIRTWLADAKNHFANDLSALSEAQLGESFAGGARTPFDLTYECALVLRRWTKRIKGVPLEPMSPGPMVRAPEEFKSREVARHEFEAAFDEFLATWDGLAPDEIGRTIETPGGPTSPADLALLAVYHTGYHDGQLAYLQTLHGDHEVRW